jgi:hypothetical protein
MKKFLKYFTLLFFALAVLSSCDKNDEPDPYPSDQVVGCYVVNYGSYGKGGASISRYNYTTGILTNSYYKTQNAGLDLLSNIQYAYNVNDDVFLLGNSPDQVITVDPLFVQAKNGVTDQIAKPRACVASGDYLYVSCWGSNPDWSAMADTYIAKYNMKTRTVEKKISLPGGPEGVEIANGKLYAALNYKKDVAVINLSTEAITYIETPAVASYFVKDNSENLYVSLIDSYSTPSKTTGLGYINTSTDKLATTYTLANVSTEYASIMAANSDKSKIYVITSAYDANWNLTGAVSVFDVATKTFSAQSLISNISGPKGLTVNPSDGNIYLFTGESVTGAGLMKIYKPSGEFVKQESVGASPSMAIFLE